MEARTSHIAGESSEWCRPFGKQFGKVVPQKVKHGVSPAIPLLHIYTQEK